MYLDTEFVQNHFLIYSFLFFLNCFCDYCVYISSLFVLILNPFKCLSLFLFLQYDLQNKIKWALKKCLVY